jgi:hypothetical protein
MKHLIPALYALAILTGAGLLFSIGSHWADTKQINGTLRFWGLVCILVPVGILVYNYIKQEKKSDNNHL